MQQHTLPLRSGVGSSTMMSISFLRANRRGLFFTIDGIFALLIALGSIIFIYAALGHTEKIDTRSASQAIMGNSILEDLERQGTLASYVKTGNATLLTTALDRAVPSYVCYNVSVWTNSIAIGEASQNCAAFAQNSVSYQSFYTNGALYYARMFLFYE